MNYGACKVCSGPLRKQVNKRLSQGNTLTDVMAYCAEQGEPISKPTLLRHKRHITDPMTTVVDEARKNPAIKRVSEQEFLQTLVDIGAQHVAESPNLVSIDQSIRAAQTLANRQQKQTDVLLVIAERLVPKVAPIDVIEGEYKELTTSAES